MPKISRNQSEQLVNYYYKVAVNYYKVMYVKDDPQDAPSKKRNIIADISAKEIREFPPCCYLVIQSLLFLLNLLAQ